MSDKCSARTFLMIGLTLLFGFCDLAFSQDGNARANLPGKWSSLDPHTKNWIRVEIIAEGDEWVMKNWSMTGREPNRKESQGPDLRIRFRNDGNSIAVAEAESNFSKVSATIILTKNTLFLETNFDYADEKRDDQTYLSVMRRDGDGNYNSPAAGTEPIVGMWKNTDPDARAFTRVQVLERDAYYLLLPWGPAGGNEVPLGYRFLQFTDDKKKDRGVASKNSGFSVVTSKLKLRNDTLEIESEYDYKDNSRRRDVTIEEEFEK